MPTDKQENLAKLRIKYPNLNKGELVKKGGYGLTVRRTPSKVLETKGYKKALGDYGLTLGLIEKSLVSDIKGKPRRRVQELNLGAEILGLKKPIDNPNDKPELHIHFHKDEKILKIVAETEKQIKRELAEQIK